MKIKVNGKEFEVAEDDEINVYQEPCDTCGKHTEIYHKRNDKLIEKKTDMNLT